MDNIKIDGINGIIKVFLGILIHQWMIQKDGGGSVGEPVGRLPIFTSRRLVRVIQVITAVSIIPYPGVKIFIITQGITIIAENPVKRPCRPDTLLYHLHIMAGQERNGERIHIVDLPVCLVHRQITRLADNGVFIDGQRLVLPVQQIARRFKDSLALVGLGTQDRHIYEEAVPVVTLELIERHVNLVVVLAAVVVITVFRKSLPVHLQLEIRRLRRYRTNNS